MRTPRIVRTILACAGATTIVCALWLGARPLAETTGCAPTRSSAQASDRKAHAYFESLAARSDCYKAFSLRDAAQVHEHSVSKSRPQSVTYDPANDPDPRRQDAAKIVVAANKASLSNQIRLPIGTSDGTTTLVTWDVWFGKEFQFANTGVGQYKTFQFSSPGDRLWCEVRTKFRQDEARNTRRAQTVAHGGKSRAGKDVRMDGDQAAATGQTAEPPRQEPPGGGKGKNRRHAEAPSQAKANDRGSLDIGVVDVRAYGASGVMLGPNVLKGAPLAPQAGSFTIRAETWTRYWMLIDQRADDWDLVSLWVADENHDPVQLVDRRQLNVKRSVDLFWVEFNTSGHARNGSGERVGYIRNVVMLRNVRDVPGLLRRPVR
jgi:hypothetical protein